MFKENTKEEKMTNILFLAQFAPTNGIVLNPPKTSEEKFMPRLTIGKLLIYCRNQNIT